MTWMARRVQTYACALFVGGHVFGPVVVLVLVFVFVLVDVHVLW